MHTPSTRPCTRERVEEIAREVGTLLIAFTTLDAAFAAEPDRRSLVLLTFLPLGAILIVGSLWAERRR